MGSGAPLKVGIQRIQCTAGTCTVITVVESFPPCQVETRGFRCETHREGKTATFADLEEIVNRELQLRLEQT